MNEKMEKAINKQINAELYSSYLYLSMASYFESINLPGFANWMYVQVKEETDHGMKFFHYVNERGGRVILETIETPSSNWDSPQDVFEAVYKHECHVSELVGELVDLAIEEKDHSTNNFLQWFVAEQVEEEAAADGVLQKLKLVGDSAGLFMIDQELGQRVYTPPAAAE